ncbi:MAG: hypothetical protein CL927_08990 [Deltaproteobacteria bacterium]|nr:hypothetical protein [Deltaproteobacteria bacterium]HCH65288.1 hypothetical protein [Deltaproteobacteria bacterium]
MQSKRHTTPAQESLDTSGVESNNPAGLQSQQAFGNAFLAEQLNTSNGAGPASTDGAKRREVNAASAGDPAADLAAFRSTKFAPLSEYRWGDDTRGLFDVAFDAGSGTLVIDLRVAYQFKDGDPSKFPYFDPQEFTWSGKEKKKFKKQYAKQTKKAWGGQFQFFSTRPGWDEMVVNTRTRVIEDDQSPHYIIEASKYPDDAGFVQSYMTQATRRSDGNLRPGTVTVDNNDLDVDRKQRSDHGFFTAYFDEGSPKLDSDAKASVTGAVDELDKPKKGYVDVVSTAVVEGDAKYQGRGDDEEGIALARKRLDAVTRTLKAEGVKPKNVISESKVETDSKYSPRVTLWPLDRDPQNAAMHETGHMYGLGDEIESEGRAIDPTYAELVMDQTGEVIERGPANDSLMSAGDTIEPMHYAPFLAALKSITGSEDWSL